MFKLPGVFPGSDAEVLFRTVGFIIVQWGHAEQLLEVIVNTLYEHYPGDKPKNPPFVLEKKLDFLRDKATSATNPIAYSDGLLKLRTDFLSMSDLRHGLIHGAIESLEPEGAIFTFIKLRSNKNDGKPRIVRLSSSDFPSLTMRLLHLGENSSRLARKLWDERPSTS